ncbi:MAG: hypothetical protein QM770_10820 [Tepidisphaeraceae bacterium]
MKLLCDVLNVSRSGFYAWLKREPGARQQRRAVLVERIESIHEGSRCTYGSPRIVAELRPRSTTSVATPSRCTCGKKASPRSASHASCRAPPTARTTTPSRPTGSNDASAPNRKWACDLTCVFTEEGWLYLSVVIDAEGLPSAPL